MACYYHLPYWANNSSWEKLHLSPGKVLAAGACRTPVPVPWWQGDSCPHAVVAMEWSSCPAAAIDQPGVEAAAQNGEEQLPAGRASGEGIKS